MSDLTRPLALTEGRLMVQVVTLVDLHSTALEREQGLSEQTLSRIQDAINRYLDRERSERMAYAQAQRDRT